jgi:hypothetical protein
LRERVTMNASAMVRESYEWNAVAQKMSEVYKGITT